LLPEKDVAIQEGECATTLYVGRERLGHVTGAHVVDEDAQAEPALSTEAIPEAILEAIVAFTPLGERA
jgi:hypothetical protein